MKQSLTPEDDNKRDTIDTVNTVTHWLAIAKMPEIQYIVFFIVHLKYECSKLQLKFNFSEI